MGVAAALFVLGGPRGYWQPGRFAYFRFLRAA